MVKRIFNFGKQSVERKTLTLSEELEILINRFSEKDKSDSLDFILANHLRRCLHNYEATVEETNIWWENYNQ